MENEVSPFGEWLDSIMSVDEGYAHYNTHVSELTEKAGHKVSVRNLQRYRARTVVPSLKSAMILMEVLGVDATAEQIIQSIELEKAIQSRQDIGYEKTIRLQIKLADIADEVGGGSDMDIEEIINDRARDLFNGESVSIAKYVISLISKDITENILGE